MELQSLSASRLYLPGRCQCCSLPCHCRRVDGGAELVRATLGSHLRETGRQLVTDPQRIKDPVDFVERLLAEKDKYDRCAAALPPIVCHR